MTPFRVVRSSTSLFPSSDQLRDGLGGALKAFPSVLRRTPGASGAIEPFDLGARCKTETMSSFGGANMVGTGRARDSKR